MKLDTDQLITSALDARSRAYAPYSKFLVGAALLDSEGNIHPGCNVENASYGLTICAERNAVFRAVASGSQEFSAIAIAVPGAGTPCGACRQVLHEFNPNMQIILCDEHGKNIRQFSLDQLLPEAFPDGA